MTTRDQDEPLVYVHEPDLRLTREERYASALSAAAAANQRIQALEGNLTVSEYHREQLEIELSGIKFDPHLGTVYTHADEEPNARIVIDIRTGHIWQVDDNAAEWTERWFRRDGDGEAYYRSGWPIEEAGPFIAIDDDWGQLRNIEASEKRRSDEYALRQLIRELPGYKDPEDDSRWSLPDLVPALKRVLAAKDLARGEEAMKAAAADKTAREAQKELADAKAEAARGYGTVLDGILKAMPAPAPLGAELSVHQVVKRAELAILQDCDVPADGGDPAYALQSLLNATALLVLAAQELMGVPATDPEPADDLPPF